MSGGVSWIEGTPLQVKLLFALCYCLQKIGHHIDIPIETVEVLCDNRHWLTETCDRLQMTLVFSPEHGSVLRFQMNPLPKPAENVEYKRAITRRTE